MSFIPKILIIAGSDSGGGAGIQADIKTTTFFKGYAMTVVTAITAQNTIGVQSIYPLPKQIVIDQINSINNDLPPDVIKIGMLADEEIIEYISMNISNHKIILDPVMVAKGGFKLINDKAVKTLREKLIKKVFLITPNIPEAEVLTKTKIKNLEDMIRAANILLNSGVKNVLVKGGHGKSKVTKDVFLNKKEIKIFRNKKIKTKNTHGTGCTLSSAIATFFACGKSINKSCELGIKYVNQSLRSNLNYGKGHGPINHLSSINIDNKFR